MNLSSIRFYRLDGVLQGGVDRQSTPEAPSLTPIIDRYLPEHPEIWPALDDFSHKSGIIKLGETFLIFATKNVRPTNQQGPAVGRLIFMRLLDGQFPILISTLSKLDIYMRHSLFDESDENFEHRKVPLPPLLSIAKATYDLQEKTLIQARIFAYDSQNNVALEFHFSLPRELKAQSTKTLRIILLAFLVSILLTLVAQTWGLQKLLLEKLIHLRDEVSIIAVRTTNLRKVTVHGQTEVRDLATKINEMLDFLEERHRLDEQQADKIHKLQLDQVLLEERETGEKSLRLASELRFYLASMLAHRINNPINFVQLSASNSIQIIDHIEKLFNNLFSGIPENDPEVQTCQKEFKEAFVQLRELHATMEKGLKKSAESIREIRLLSGVDGAQVQSIDSTTMSHLFQELIQDLSMDQWSKRLLWKEVSQHSWAINLDISILKNALELLITVCLQNSEGLMTCTLMGQSAEDWAFVLQGAFRWDHVLLSALERSLKHILQPCEGEFHLEASPQSVKVRFFTRAS